MVEKTRVWKDLGFVNNKLKNEPIPDFSWGELSEADAATAKRTDLTRAEALAVVDHWIEANGAEAWISPAHPLKSIVLGLRPVSPFIVKVQDHNWITLKKTELGKIVASVWNIQRSEDLSIRNGQLIKDRKAQAFPAGDFTIRESQEAVA